MDQCNFKPMFKYLCQYDKSSCYTKIIKHLEFEYMCDMCCKYNRIDILKYLLLEINSNAVYALESSCTYNNILIWKWLLKKSNGKQIQNKTYMFVFEMCCENDYLDIFESLVSKNDELLDVEKMFHICCIYDSVKIAKYIVENYDIDIEQEYVNACYQNSINVVKLLFHDIKNVNYEQIFDHLCIHGYYKLCKWLYTEMNYDMFCKGNFRFTIACERGYFDIVKMFVENDVNVIKDINDIMLRVVSSENVKLFNYLLTVNSSMTNINDLIDVAIFNDDVDITKVIINMKMYEKTSLVKKCCDNDSRELFIYLIQTYNDEIDINEVFEYACIKNRIFIITHLIHYSTIKNDTTYILLKCYNQIDTVKVLLSLNEKHITNSILLTCITECVKNSDGTLDVLKELLNVYSDEIPDYIYLLCQMKNHDKMSNYLKNIKRK